MGEVEEIWTEKYRPKKLREIIGQQHAVPRLEAFVKNKSLPHCIFAGPAGSGKTTAALCIARELYGDSWHSNFLELNASDARGIDTVRVQIKDFARTMPLDGSFKIIYLDEADALTKDAQHALRRTMEKYAKTARFILSCNYSSKIISPIQSRCAVFRFPQLSSEDITGFLKKISGDESLHADDNAFEAILYISEGDMRKAINILQTAAVLGKKITEETVYDATSKADPKAVVRMLNSALKAKFREARKELLSLMIERGLAGEDIIKEIHKQIFDTETDDEIKLQLLEALGEYEFRITEGSNARIQLEALLARIGVIGKGKS